MTQEELKKESYALQYQWQVHTQEIIDLANRHARECVERIETKPERALYSASAPTILPENWEVLENIMQDVATDISADYKELIDRQKKAIIKELEA